ncbi:MAG TPA: aminopeptidase P family N-terminal domain-containing protein [Burkholderiales bacterium]|nr:aminopeptidase P family N-terminal domain-containing protein [Burkholderiales bacterium]
MRHGLIAWSRDEVPASALDARVAKLQAAMRKEALDCVLVYSSFARPAAVAWLTHFVPYWNDALLAVFPDGAPVLLAAFSKRMNPWIHETSRVGEVRAAPDLGKGAAALMSEKRVSRLGVVELDALPWRIAQPIADPTRDAELVDASGVFTDVRHPADAFEIALARRAAQIARRALDAAADGSRLASHALAAAERSARLEGAEDVIARLAPDLREDATLVRMEGDAPLGARWALELTVSYKATAVRVTRSFASGATPPSWREADAWLERTVAASAMADGAPGRVAAYRVDVALGTEPLATWDTDGPETSVPLHDGTLGVLSVKLEPKDGAWLAAVPVLIGRGPL